MMGRKYGSRYDASLTTKAIAARMRTVVTTAIAEGALPDLKVSIRCSSGPLSSSINIVVTGVPSGFPLINEHAWSRDADGWVHLDAPRERYLPEMSKALAWLLALHASYNHDGSDIGTDYFDVNYYGRVTVDYELEQSVLRTLEPRDAPNLGGVQA